MTDLRKAFPRAFVCIVLVGLLLMLPAALFGPGATDSAPYNGAWAEAFAASYREGEFYPRWLPHSFEGLGSPAFYFYPPFAYWIAGAFALWLPTEAAITASGAFLLIASGLSMYAFLARLNARPVLGAILYMAAPYHLLDFYVRGALAEFAAYAWLPLIALSILALPSRWAVALLAVSFAGAIISHLPLAMLSCFFLILPLAAWRMSQDRSVILPGLAAGALGLAGAAFYLLPALALQGYISDQLFWGEHYQPSNWSIWTLHKPYYLGMVLGIGGGCLLLASRSRSIWLLVTAAAVVGAWGLLPPMWDLPLLRNAQFPWRLLCVVEFAAITALLLSPPRPIFAAAAGALLLNAYVGQIVATAATMRVEPAYYDAPEYLPRAFNVSGVTDLRRRVDLAPYRAWPRTDKVIVSSSQTITLGRNAFPIWRVERDGAVVPSRGPLITFEATPGVYALVRVRLWQEVVGAALTCLALAGVILLLLSRGRTRSPVLWRKG